MLERFLSRGSFQWVHLQEPSYKVQEVRIITLETLFESRLLSNHDMNLQLFVVHRLCRFLFCAFLALFFFIAIFRLLVDQAFSREEIGNKSALFHHVLGERPYNADNPAE